MPQVTVPPQPLGMVPQLSPAGQVVMGVQLLPHWLATPPPPQVCGAVQVPQATVPPQPLGTVPQLSPAGQVVMGVQTAGQMSSCAGVEDWSHALVPHAVWLLEVHCSQSPKSTLVPVVSQTPVAPVQALPVSPHEHLRQLVSVVPEQTGRAVPLATHLPCLLLQRSWTVQVRPPTVMVSPAPSSSQMSPISPHWLLASYQPTGFSIMVAVAGSRPMSGSVTVSTSSWEAVLVMFSSGVAAVPQPVAHPPVNSSMSTP